MRRGTLSIGAVLVFTLSSTGPAPMLPAAAATPGAVLPAAAAPARAVTPTLIDIPLGASDSPATGARLLPVASAAVGTAAGDGLGTTAAGGDRAKGRSRPRSLGSRADAAGPATLVLSRPVTRQFAALGVTWRPDPKAGPVRVPYRHRLGAGDWSRWESTGPGDTGPDADRTGGHAQRDGTDLIWTGSSDGVQLSVRVPAGRVLRDVRLTLIDPKVAPADQLPPVPAGTAPSPAVPALSPPALPSPARPSPVLSPPAQAQPALSPPATATRATSPSSGGAGTATQAAPGVGREAGARAGMGVRPSTAAAAAAAARPVIGVGSGTGVDASAAPRAALKPLVYSRAQWGADPALMGWTPQYSPTITAGFLHHTATGNSYAAADVPRLLRAIYSFHSVTRGWGDIGYNFLVDRFGRIWEGRYGGVDSTVIGAHTGGFNYDTFGVAMLGTYSTTAVPAAAINSVAQLFAWKLATRYRNPVGQVRLTSAGGGTSRYARGTQVVLAVIAGHRDVGRTDCPGNRGYAALPALRKLVLGVMTTGLVSPVASARTVAYRGVGPRLTATIVRRSSWALAIAESCSGHVVRRYAGTGTKIDVRWDLRNQSRGCTRPGVYQLTLTTAWGGRFGVPFAPGVTVTSPASRLTPVTGQPPTTGPAGYVPIPPVRILDTRGRLGGGTGLPLSAGGRVDVPVLGVGAIPRAGVAAVAVELTALCPTTTTWIFAWASGSPRPAGGALAVSPPVRSTRSVVKLGVGGRISVAVDSPSVTTDLVIEAVGYLPTGGESVFHPVNDWHTDVTMRPAETRSLDLPTLTGGVVPPAATAVAVNLTAAAPTLDGYLRAWPAGTGAPSTVSLAYSPGTSQSALQLAALGATGGLQLNNDGLGAVGVGIDVTGWFGPASTPGGAPLLMLPQTRVADVRLTGAAASTVALTGTTTGVPAGATVALLRVAGISTGAAGAEVLVYPDAAHLTPGARFFATAANRWTSNIALVQVAADGTVQLATQTGATHLVVDVLGYAVP